MNGMRLAPLTTVADALLVISICRPLSIGSAAKTFIDFFGDAPQAA
jgi:hypothetical protein